MLGSNVELRRSVKEYRRLWEEAGLDLSPVWRRSAARITQPKRPAPVSVPADSSVALTEGNPQALLIFVGENDGSASSGTPFRGPAGELLTKIIEAMGFDRKRDIHLTGLLKAAEGWEGFLQTQVAAIQPRIVVALGDAAAACLLGTEEKIPALRGRFHPLKWDPTVLVMPTFHPSHLLLQPAAKKEAWEDMKKVVGVLAGAKR